MKKATTALCVSILALACNLTSCSEEQPSDPPHQNQDETNDNQDASNVELGIECGYAFCKEGLICADAVEGKFCVKEIPKCENNQKLSYDKSDNSVTCKLSVTCNDIPCALGQQCANTEDGKFCVDELPTCEADQKLYYDDETQEAYCDDEEIHIPVQSDACNNTCAADEKCMAAGSLVNQTQAICVKEDGITDDECENGLQLNDDGSVTCAEAQTCGDITCEVGKSCVQAYVDTETDYELQNVCVTIVPPCDYEDQVLEYDANDEAVYCVSNYVIRCEDDSGCEEGYICDDIEKVCVKGSREDNADNDHGYSATCTPIDYDAEDDNPNNDMPDWTMKNASKRDIVDYLVSVCRLSTYFQTDEFLNRAAADQGIGSQCFCYGQFCEMVGYERPESQVTPSSEANVYGTLFGCDGVTDYKGAQKSCFRTSTVENIKPKIYFPNGTCSLAMSKCTPETDNAEDSICSFAKFGDYSKLDTFTACPNMEEVLVDFVMPIEVGGGVNAKARLDVRACFKGCKTDADCHAVGVYDPIEGAQSQTKCVELSNDAGEKAGICFDMRTVEGVEQDMKLVHRGKWAR